MLRLLLIACLAALAASIDRDAFKSCARVPFCTAMRHQDVSDYYYYYADINGHSINDNVVTVPLKNNNGDELDLQISVLTEGKARVKVLEKNNNRYEIIDVLDQDVSAVSIKKEQTDNKLTLSPEYDSNFVIQVNGPGPFSVEFLYNGRVQNVLKGDRLVVTSNDTSQAFSFGVEFNGAKKLYGLLHHAYKLALGETADDSTDPFRLRNSDAAYYDFDSTMALYGAVPAVYGHSSDGTSGVFLLNAAEQWVDISYSGDNPSAYFMAESGSFDLFILIGPKPKDVVRQFTDLTGRAHLPQLWTLGYHQCRYSYQTQEEVKEVVANMDSHDFPMDAIWLDIDYTDGKKYFTWNPGTFSDPEEMQSNLSSTNRKLVTIIDPHFKVDDDYPVYAGAKDNLFMKWPNGNNYEDNCWPGQSSWLDFLNPEARNYYADWFSFDKFKGSTETLAGIWNDMNEPAIFNREYENTAPFEVLHTGNVPHRDVHNMYGFLQSMASHQGLMQRDKGEKRPFVLTRSHFAGSQRYAAMWTGDNVADWPYLRITYPECMTSNILGLVFCGADIGGFMNNPEDELLQRWYQAGIWLPFFRGHSNSNTNRREPYLFNDDMQTVIRKAMKLRYKHIPVWYTLFYEHTRNGGPIVRPFFYDYPEYLEQDDHVLVGTDILARPVLESRVSSIKVVFPGSETSWYRVDDDSWSIHKGDTSEDLDVDMSTSPYYYRAGSIITRKEGNSKSTSDLQKDPLTLYVNLDKDGNAQGTYYQDDYESFKYSNDNDFLYVTFTYIPSSHAIDITVIDGNSGGQTPTLQDVIVHDFSGTQKNSEVKYTTDSNGNPLHTIDIGGHFAKTKTNKMTILL